MKRHGLPVAGQCAKIRAHDDGKPQRSKDFRAHDKLRVVVQASGLNDSQLGAFLREQAMHEDDLQRWRQEALQGLSGNNKALPPSKRTRELERELRRKEKALAETATRLVLTKKPECCGWTRTTTPARAEAGHDDADR